MSDMTLIESVERFDESLKRASSRAKELGRLHNDKSWNSLASAIDGLRKNGIDIYESKQMSRQDVLSFLDKHQKTMTKETIQ